MSWINLGEVYYTVHRTAGAAEADTTLAQLRPLLMLDAATPERVMVAARIKAVHPAGLWRRLCRGDRGRARRDPAHG